MKLLAFLKQFGPWEMFRVVIWAYKEPEARESDGELDKCTEEVPLFAGWVEDIPWTITEMMIAQPKNTDKADWSGVSLRRDLGAEYNHVEGLVIVVKEDTYR